VNVKIRSSEGKKVESKRVYTVDQVDALDDLSAENRVKGI